MKLMWFHLMPYTELPDDFREKHPSVWVDIHSSLFDPRRAHHMYNDFMDELEFAAECGFDAVCVNEHHSNGYGLMPSPNLIASSLARRTTDTALCVMGNSLALYNPPTRVAEEFAMIDVHLGRAADRRLPGRHADGHLLRLRPEPEHAARALSTRRTTSWCGPGPSRTPSPSTAASTSSATSTSGRARCRSRTRRSGSRAAARSRPGSGAPRWTTSTPICPISATRPARRRWTGFWDEMDRLGKDRNPYRAGFLQFVGVAESREEAIELYREPAEYFYGRCLHVDPRFAGRPATPPRRRSAPGSQARSRRRRRHAPASTTLGARDGCDRREGLRDHRLARRGRRAAEARWRPTSMSAT